jgi:hypothetical protein
MKCNQCGQEFFITLDGVSHHVGDGPDGIDHDADADHVAYGQEMTDQPDADDLDGQKTFDTLFPYSKKIATDVMTKINKTVPMGIPTMRYARQWVLEETIKLLQAQV